MRATARVTVTVEVFVSAENWNEHTDIGALHREAKEKAERQLKEICDRSRAVTLVGTPRVTAVFVEEERRG